jgi:hypothetical protein
MPPTQSLANTSARLSIRADTDASLGRTIEAAVASLPDSFLNATSNEANVVVTDGTQDWVDTAAETLRSGARGVMVVGPRRAEPAELIKLAALADEHHAPVVCAYPWASNPLVAVVKESWPEAAGPSDFVEVTSDSASTSNAWIGAVVDQLMLVSTLFGELVGVRLLWRAPTGYAIAAEIAVRDSSLPVSIIASTSDHGQGGVTVRRMSLTHRTEIVIPFPKDARPARARLITESEEFVQPLLYENSLRASLLRLSDLVRRDVGFGDDVRRLAQLCEVLGAAWESATP